MIEYDPKDIGLKVNEIHPNIRKILELFIIPEQKEYCIGYIHGKILECITNKDVVTAIAIANCAIGITGIEAQEFKLDFILTTAEENNYEDVAVSFLGMCKALHYVEENN